MTDYDDFSQDPQDQSQAKVCGGMIWNWDTLYSSEPRHLPFHTTQYTETKCHDGAGIYILSTA
jgi:hypothetical protein